MPHPPLGPQMPHQLEWRHAEPVRTDIEGKAQQLAAFPAPIIARQQAAHVEDIALAAMPGEVRVHRRIEDVRRQSQRAGGGFGQLMMPRAGQQARGTSIPRPTPQRVPRTPCAESHAGQMSRADRKAI